MYVHPSKSTFRFSSLSCSLCLFCPLLFVGGTGRERFPLSPTSLFRSTPFFALARAPSRPVLHTRTCSKASSPRVQRRSSSPDIFPSSVTVADVVRVCVPHVSLERVSLFPAFFCCSLPRLSPRACVCCDRFVVGHRGVLPLHARLCTEFRCGGVVLQDSLQSLHVLVFLWSSLVLLCFSLPPFFVVLFSSSE